MPLYTPKYFLANIVNVLALTAANLFVLFPLYLLKVPRAEWMVGLIMGAFSVAAVMVRPALGHRMDVHGRRPFMLAGLAVSAVLPVAYLALGQFTPGLFVVRLVQGGVFAIYITAFITWIADLAPPGRMAEALGMAGVSGLLTMGLGSALAEAIVAAGGFAALFISASGLYVVALLCCLPLPEAAHLERSVPASGAFLDVARRPALRSAVLVNFIFGIGIVAVYTFIAPYLRDPAAVASLYACYTAFAMGIRLLAGPVADRVGRKALIVPALAVYGAGVALLSVAPGHSTVMLAVGALMGLGHGVMYPSLSAQVVDRVSATERGKAISLFTACGDLGGFLGAVACGALASWLGLSGMFASLGLLFAVGVVAYLALEGQALTEENFV